MALNRVDSETRFSMTEAPIELIEPTRDVVDIAMVLLKEHGSTDELSRQRAVFLNKNTNRIYGLSRNTNTGWESSGLFISGLQLDGEGHPLHKISEFQAPQNPNLVTQENIFILRGILPDSMEQLGEELTDSEAVPMSYEEYSSIRSATPNN